MRGRSVALSIFLFIFSLALFFATGELALRLLYRDAGTRTLGGPGGSGFEHLTVEGDQRGRFDAGAKITGRPRIMVVGDSITWGQGVRNWQDTWPEQLALSLERAGTPHEMAVLAMPGRDIVQHVDEVEHWAPQLQPDIFIYQWYVNDIEVESHRPVNQRVWRTWPTHNALLRLSYLYYFADNRLATFLPPPDRSYADYIVQDFVPGTLEWAEFERYFHRLAGRAMEYAGTRVLLLYPQVPFRDGYPLKPVHDRVSALAFKHLLTIPPSAWTRHGGTLEERRDAPFGRAVRASSTSGPLIETRDYYMPVGGLEIVLTIAQENTGTGASLEVIDAATNEVVGSTPLALEGRAGWQEIAARPLSPSKPALVRLRLSSTGTTPFEIARLAMPVDYGFETLDLTDALNAFDTHASVFDAHPNERAHRVVADAVFEALRRAAGRR
jgi:hypothetical protein